MIQYDAFVESDISELEGKSYRAVEWLESNLEYARQTYLENTIGRVNQDGKLDARNPDVRRNADGSLDGCCRAARRLIYLGIPITHM